MAPRNVADPAKTREAVAALTGWLHDDTAPAPERSALAEAVRTTFNRADSDGCMSTNDTVLLLASGASGHAPDPGEFTELLRGACADLARLLIGDDKKA